MIEVTVEPNEIRLEGHSCRGHPDHSIVCAAVTTLTTNLVASAEALCEDKISYTLESGFARIIYRNPSEQLKLLIDSFFVGISGIADAHPESVTIKETRNGSL